MVQAVTYGRPVFEALLQLCGPGDLVDPFVRVNDRGVWIGEPVGGLDWTPLCDLVEPGSPDPLSEPALPFPFTAAQLAAFLLDGWGFSLREAAGEWADGPDEALLLTLGGRYGKVREALQEGYRIFRDAAASVAPLDPALEEDAQRIWMQRRKAESEANQKAGWRERGITEEERGIRLACARKSTATIVQRHKEAKAIADSAYLTWRRAMVRQLLGMGDTRLPQQIAHTDDQPGRRNVHGLKPARVYWRALLHEHIAAIDVERRVEIATVISWLVNNSGGRIKRHPNGIAWKDDLGSWVEVQRHSVSTATSAARRGNKTSS